MLTPRLLLAAVSATAVLAAAPAQASPRSCGFTGALAQHIKADGTTCRAAKRLVSHFISRDLDHTRTITVDGYTCKPHLLPKRQWTVRCNKPGKLVSWLGEPYL